MKSKSKQTGTNTRNQIRIATIPILVGAVLGISCFSMRYSVLVTVMWDIHTNELQKVNEPMLVTAITEPAATAVDTSAASNKSIASPQKQISVSTMEGTISNAAERSENHSRKIRDYTDASPVPPIIHPGRRLYDESLDFLQKLLVELGIKQWKKYLKKKKGKRFKKGSSGNKFTQKIYAIAAETITAPSNDKNAPLDDKNLVIPMKTPVNATNNSTINCADPKYFKAFTGNLDPDGDKIIVDWTMVGWDDRDFTEIRLAEYGDLIDRLVLFDMDTTLKGIPKPIIMPHLLEEQFKHLYSNKIDYHLLRNFTADFFSNATKKTKKKIGYRLQIQLRNRGRDYTKDLYKDHTARDRVYVIQNDGDEMMTRDSLLHVIKCELKNPNGVLFAPAVNFKRNLAWLDKGSRMEIMIHSEQAQYSAMIPYNWLKGPAVQRLYGNITKKNSNFRKPYFHSDENFKVPHLGLGSAVHFSSPGHPLSTVLKSMSTNDDPNFLKEFDSEFLNKALTKNLTYLELRKIGFKCKSIPNIREAFVNKSTVNFALSNIPWIVKAMPERYPWLVYDNMLETEQKVKECICAEDWRSTIGQKQECLALQNRPWG